MIKKLKPIEKHNSMRGWFAFELHEHMRKNKNIFLLTGDLGYGMLDRIKNDFPDRFVNVGAAEQLLMGVGVGMALKGKIPFVYSITPFLLYRPFETIRNYVNHEKIPVVLVGGGRNKDYSHDGFSHWSEEDKQVMKLFTNIESFWPDNKEEIPNLVSSIIANPKPYYLNLRR